MKTSDLFYTPPLYRLLRQSKKCQGERDNNPSPRQRRLVFLRDIRRFLPFESRMRIIKTLRKGEGDYEETFS